MTSEKPNDVHQEKKRRLEPNENKSTEVAQTAKEPTFVQVWNKFEKFDVQKFQLEVSKCALQKYGRTIIWSDSEVTFVTYENNFEIGLKTNIETVTDDMAKVWPSAKFILASIRAIPPLYSDFNHICYFRSMEDLLQMNTSSNFMLDCVSATSCYSRCSTEPASLQQEMTDIAKNKFGVTIVWDLSHLSNCVSYICLSSHTLEDAIKKMCHDCERGQLTKARCVLKKFARQTTLEYILYFKLDELELQKLLQSRPLVSIKLPQTPKTV